MKIILAVISTLLVACSPYQSELSEKKDIRILSSYRSPDFIIKNSDIAYAHRMESTPVIFKGRLYDVLGNRFAAQPVIDIIDGESTALISSTALGIGLSSALVYQDQLYIAGSTGWWSDSLPLKIYRTSNLVNFVEVGKLEVESDRRIFNSSIIHDGQRFVIVVEVDKNKDSRFFASFYESTDLVHWKKISDLKQFDYMACPTLRFVNGVYYLFYLLFDTDQHIFYTSISKSVDLNQWKHSSQVVLAPDVSEGQNNSDLDLVEFNSQVVLNYAVGNQENDRPFWIDIKRATYLGSLEDFVNRFF